MTAFAASDSTRLAPAVQGCVEACRRCRILVETVAGQEGTAYQAIGPQLRHCLDHFRCFLRGIDSGLVDYDARERDENLERDPTRFLNALDEVVGRVKSVDPGLGRTLAMRQEAAPGGNSRTVDTTVERELLFLSSHTIHHLAIMTLLARREGVEVSRDLGMAFSTASHEAGRVKQS